MTWENPPIIDDEVLADEDGPDRELPRFERLPGGGYVYHVLQSLAVEVRYLRRDHGLHAEVDVRCAWAGARTHRGSLACSDLNLSSLPARKAFAK